MYTNDFTGWCFGVARLRQHLYLYVCILYIYHILIYVYILYVLCILYVYMYVYTQLEYTEGGTRRAYSPERWDGKG